MMHTSMSKFSLKLHMTLANYKFKKSIACHGVFYDSEQKELMICMYAFY